MSEILDGLHVATILKNKLQKDVKKHMQAGGRAPGLAVILVGADPASLVYVTNKRKTCKALGFNSFAYNLPYNTTEKELLNLLYKLNFDQNVDGILIQLPLPSHIDAGQIIEAIDPKKDVDGFHPYNLGRLAQGDPLLRPCTPYGIIKLLDYYAINLYGKNVVVVGASNIVGRPMALECLMAKATVTICHRETQNLRRHIQGADVIVVATGTKNPIELRWLNTNQVLVDVGIHRLANGIIRGDIDFDLAKEHVAWITPVPGGVGPMTICMLMYNTWSAAQV